MRSVGSTRTAEGRVVLAGASGLIGRALARSLRQDGIPVSVLVRRPARSDDEVPWLQTTAPLDPDVIAGARAVVGLSGASIGRFPWSRRYRSELIWSRLTPTRTLATAVRALGEDAPAFLSASAVGYYGDYGIAVTESAAAGDTFLARLCVVWEDAALSAGDRARTVLLRTAPLVHPDAALKPLIQLTRLGVAGPIGRGTQSWPWISLRDEVRAIRHAIDTELSGPVNLAGPRRATANDLGFALAVRMNRPYLVRTPVWALRAVLGRDAVSALLSEDVEVFPKALLDSGFAFTHPTVEDAVADAVPAAVSHEPGSAA